MLKKARQPGSGGNAQQKRYVYLLIKFDIFTT